MSFQAGPIPSWHESCELYALSPVAAVSRWLLPLQSRYCQPGTERRLWNYPGIGADYPPAWFLRKADQARAIMVLRTSW